MSDDASERLVVGLFHGFKPASKPGPCFWCGVPTSLLDAEGVRVCEEHQKEEIAFGYAEMKKKYRQKH